MKTAEKYLSFICFVSVMIVGIHFVCVTGVVVEHHLYCSKPVLTVPKKLVSSLIFTSL